MPILTRATFVSGFGSTATEDEALVVTLRVQALKLLLGIHNTRADGIDPLLNLLLKVLLVAAEGKIA